MPWAALDDHFHDNPKVLDAPLAAVGLYAIGLSYCNAQLSDGFIPRSVIVGIRGWAAAAKELIERHFWEPAEGGGFRVHDYLDWNRSRQVVLAERAAARDRKREARRRPAGQTPDVTRDVRPENHRMSGTTPLPSTPDGLRPSPDPPNPLTDDAAPDEAPPRRGSQECPNCRRTFIGPYSEHHCAIQRPTRRPVLGKLLPREAREPVPPEVLAELEILEKTRADRHAIAAQMAQEQA